MALIDEDIHRIIQTVNVSLVLHLNLSTKCLTQGKTLSVKKA
jgi:hypothetical protein